MRFYFIDSDQQRRDAHRAHRDRDGRLDDDGCVADRGGASPAPLSQLVLGFEDPLLMDCAILGLWAFTNIEMAYAQLRVDERARAYMFASGANVAMTVAVHDRAGRVRRPGRARSVAGQFRRERARGARLVVGSAQALLVARALGGPARDAQLWSADGAGGRERVCAAGDRSLVPVSRRQPWGGRRIRDRGATGDGRVRVRAGLPVRVAAACLLDRQRRGGLEAVLACDHLLRAWRRAWWSRPLLCWVAGWCGCSLTPNTSARTRRCRGWRSAGRCMGSIR